LPAKTSRPPRPADIGDRLPGGVLFLYLDIEEVNTLGVTVHLNLDFSIDHRSYDIVDRFGDAVNLYEPLVCPQN
jgi:hypothetical protein